MVSDVTQQLSLRETSDPTYIGHSGDWPNGIGHHTTERLVILPTSDTVATGPMVSDVTQQRDQRAYLRRTQWRLAQWYRTSHNRETSEPTYVGHSGDWPNGIGRHTTAVTQVWISLHQSTLDGFFGRGIVRSTQAETLCTQQQQQQQQRTAMNNHHHMETYTFNLHLDVRT